MPTGAITPPAPSSPVLGASGGLSRDAICRLLLTHPADVDRWAAGVGVALRLSAYHVRGLARAVAIAGDSPATRFEALNARRSSPRT